MNRSGYYKWRQRQGKMNRYERDRVELTRLLQAAHEKHPSHGYHRLAHDVFLKTGWVFSHNLAHKCCKAAGIRSKARKGRYKRPGEESILFPNQVRGHWNAAAPLQLVVSDMTTLKVGTTYWEWTILLDTFNNDQGAVYSSRAFCQAHHDYNILRSMSRGGTPTDNPIIEALNGWIKEELYLDFDLAHSHDVPALLDAYVDFFNNHRPAAALGYRSPVQFKTERGF